VVDNWPAPQLLKAVVLSLTKQQRLEQKNFVMS
jgi:hypothetical protein